MIPEEIIRKNVQVTLDVWETLTDLKKGNMTYNDVVVDLLQKAKVPLVKR